MSPIERWLKLEKDLIAIRLKNGTKDSPEEDAILDEMDFAWWDMTEAEQDEIDKPERGKAFWGELMKNPEWQEFFNKKEQKEK